MRIQFLLIAAVLLAGCKHKPEPSPGPVVRYFRFITLDSANKMITSYLNSIHYEENDTDIRALLIDMDQLRKYTDTMQGGRQIKYLKLMFAHTLEHINSGRENKPAGYRGNALTLVIAGCDTSGNYIFYTGNRVLEYCLPCPTNCPSGTALNSVLAR